MKKKFLSVILAALFIVSAASTAFAVNLPFAHTLKFDENGKFTIMNICDIQDGYPLTATTAEFIKEAIAAYNPDIVILGGDNCVASADVKADAIKELCEIFTESKTYFTFVFGNHDAEQGVDKETLFAYYKQFGGEYCLAYDAVPALTGVGTHNLPVLSSDSSKVAYNLYMFDSNMYAYDENGERLGYDCVHEDQIEWYKNTSDALKLLNGGNAVPAMAFQHIIVQEAFDELFLETSSDVGAIGKSFDGKSFIYLPKVANIKDGYLLEAMCPGYYNYGQFDAMVEEGDVVAIFSGHDHVNSFTIERDGIDIVNTPGCTYGSYGKDIDRGCRIIELNENDLSTYTSKVVSMSEMALTDGSKLTELGEITKASASLTVFTQKFLNGLIAMLKVLFVFFK